MYVIYASIIIWTVWNSVVGKSCDIESWSLAHNTTQGCNITLLCRASGSDCDDLAIHRADNNEFIRCDLTNDDSGMNCTKTDYKAVESLVVFCYIPLTAQKSPNQTINVSSIIDEVTNIKVYNHCVTWTPSNVNHGIDTICLVMVRYKNGDAITNTTVEDTELTIDFDDCQLISVEIVTMATCGNVSSNVASWNGTARSPLMIPSDRLTISYSWVDGIAVSMSYPINNTCPSAQATCGTLSCSFTTHQHIQYNVTVVQEEGNITNRLIDTTTGRDVVLKPYQSTVDCSLTLCNMAGCTEQQRKLNTSTYQLQNFTIEYNSSVHRICMKFWFVNNSILKTCEAFVNDTVIYSFAKGSVNDRFVEKCVEHHLLKGDYVVCVNLDNHICIRRSSFKVDDGGTRPSHDNGNRTAIIGILAALVGMALLIVGAIPVAFLLYHKRIKDRDENVSRSQGEQMKDIQGDDFLFESSLENTPSASSIPAVAELIMAEKNRSIIQEKAKDDPRTKIVPSHQGTLEDKAEVTITTSDPGKPLLSIKNEEEVRQRDHGTFDYTIQSVHATDTAHEKTQAVIPT